MTSKSILESVEESRKELLDLSLRNPLLNYRTLRARGVEMVGESAEQVFTTLTVERRPMSFLPGLPSEGDPAQLSLENDFDAGQPEDAAAPSITANQSDRRLQTSETLENLQKRLLNTYRLANTSIEETGVNTLFMAFGMLHWYEAEESQEGRRAPLVLVPVRLERDGVRENFRVTWTGEDIGANLSLIEKVRADFGVLLPGQDKADEVAEGTISLADYLDLVKHNVEQFRRRRWSVDRDSVVLGFFSYNKLRMFEDLDGDNWPEGEGIAENEIIAALFDDGFREPASDILQDARLDDHLNPGDTYHVVDADSSQSLAIRDAAGGRNLVIQGPPGTGKSQTITNIIAEAVARGKRVLFVSEKMAALEVVKRRLDNVGLGQACLELHSHKTNKREILDELNRILHPTDRGSYWVTGPEFGLDEMVNAISDLNSYADAVNTPVLDSGVTPHDAFGQLLALDHHETSNPLPRGKIANIRRWSAGDFRRKREVVDDLRLRLQRCGVPNRHPFWGSGLRVLLPDTRSELREKIDAALGSLQTLTSASDGLAKFLGLSRPEDAPDANDLLAAARLAFDAPVIAGLNLAAPQWESHPTLIWDLMELGLLWQWMRRERIEASDQGLRALTDASRDLAEALRAEPPADVEAAATLLAAARIALDAPDSRDLDLDAPQWGSHGRQILGLVDKGLEWRRIRTSNDAVVLPQAWDTDWREVRLSLNIDGRRLLGRLFSSRYRCSRKQLAAVMRSQVPPDVDRQIGLIDAIISEQSLRAEIDGGYPEAALALGRQWDGCNTGWEAVGASARWWLGVLEEVAANRAPVGAVPLLKKIAARPQVEALKERIDVLNSVMDVYQERARELQAVLDVGNPGWMGVRERIDALPFEDQRHLISQLPGRSSTRSPSASKPTGQTSAETSQSPAEIATGIYGFQKDVSPALGSQWDGHHTDWEGIAHAVRWWLDVLVEASAGRVPQGAVGLLQSLPVWAAGDSRQEWETQIEELGRALEGYPGGIEELQVALNMDKGLRFGNPVGLQGLPFTLQRTVLGEWAGLPLEEIEGIIGFNVGANQCLEEELRSVVEVAEWHPGAAESLTAWFERAWHETIASTAMAERTNLREFDGQVHQSRVKRFRTLDGEFQSHNR